MMMMMPGLSAFVYSNAIYCERHWADQIKARCSACDESICDPNYAIAEDQVSISKLAQALVVTHSKELAHEAFLLLCM